MNKKIIILSILFLYKDIAASIINNNGKSDITLPLIGIKSWNSYLQKLNDTTIIENLSELELAITCIENIQKESVNSIEDMQAQYQLFEKYRWDNANIDVLKESIEEKLVLYTKYLTQLKTNANHASLQYPILTEISQNLIKKVEEHLINYVNKLYDILNSSIHILWPENARLKLVSGYMIEEYIEKNALYNMYTTLIKTLTHIIAPYRKSLPTIKHEEGHSEYLYDTLNWHSTIISSDINHTDYLLYKQIALLSLYKLYTNMMYYTKNNALIVPSKKNNNKIHTNTITSWKEIHNILSLPADTPIQKIYETAAQIISIYNLTIDDTCIKLLNKLVFITWGSPIQPDENKRQQELYHADQYDIDRMIQILKTSEITKTEYEKYSPQEKIHEEFLITLISTIMQHTILHEWHKHNPVLANIHRQFKNSSINLYNTKFSIYTLIQQDIYFDITKLTMSEDIDYYVTWKMNILYWMKILNIGSLTPETKSDIPFEPSYIKDDTLPVVQNNIDDDSQTQKLLRMYEKYKTQITSNALTPEICSHILTCSLKKNTHLPVQQQCRKMLIKYLPKKYDFERNAETNTVALAQLAQIHQMLMAVKNSLEEETTKK